MPNKNIFCFDWHPLGFWAQCKNWITLALDPINICSVCFFFLSCFFLFLFFFALCGMDIVDVICSIQFSLYLLSVPLSIWQGGTRCWIAAPVSLVSSRYAASGMVRPRRSVCVGRVRRLPGVRRGFAMLLSVSPLDSGQPRSTSLIHEGVKYTGQPTTFFFFFFFESVFESEMERSACMLVFMCVCVWTVCGYRWNGV